MTSKRLVWCWIWISSSGTFRRCRPRPAHAGKHLRPHVKTHKCSTLARRQIEAGAIGVCVAKVSEAEALVKAGLDNILVTGPVATSSKVERLVDLVAAAPSLMVVIDHPGNIALLDAELGARSLSMDVLLDLDVGLHRTGARPSDALALAGQIAACPTLRLRGIQAYAGQVQHIRDYDRRKPRPTSACRTLFMFSAICRPPCPPAPSSALPARERSTLIWPSPRYPNFRWDRMCAWTPSILKSSRLKTGRDRHHSTRPCDCSQRLSAPTTTIL